MNGLSGLAHKIAPAHKIVRLHIKLGSLSLFLYRQLHRLDK